jgi:hypothetical protein
MRPERTAFRRRFETTTGWESKDMDNDQEPTPLDLPEPATPPLHEGQPANEGDNSEEQDMAYELDPDGLADQRPILRDALFRLQTLLVSAELSRDPFVLLDLNEARDLFFETVDLWRDAITPTQLPCSRRRQ